MGELVPIAALVSGAMSMQQASQQARAANAAAAAQANSQARQIRQAQEIEERRQKEQLKKVQAAQRARFGASGVGGTGGSASALLQGLAAETDRNLADMRKTNKTKLDDIHQNLALQRRKNLLDVSTARNSFFMGAMRPSLDLLGDKIGKALG